MSTGPPPPRKIWRLPDWPHFEPWSRLRNPHLSRHTRYSSAPLILSQTPRIRGRDYPPKRGPLRRRLGSRSAPHRVVIAARDAATFRNCPIYATSPATRASGAYRKLRLGGPRRIPAAPRRLCVIQIIGVHIRDSACSRRRPEGRRIFRGGPGVGIYGPNAGKFSGNGSRKRAWGPVRGQKSSLLARPRGDSPGFQIWGNSPLNSPGNPPAAKSFPGKFPGAPKKLALGG